MTTDPFGYLRTAVKQVEQDNVRLRAALKQLRREHSVCDGDSWYSCPKSGDCANDHAGEDCNCGADAANAIIDAALALEP